MERPPMIRMQSSIDKCIEQGLAVNLAATAAAVATQSERVALPPNPPPVRRHFTLEISFH